MAFTGNLGIRTICLAPAEEVPVSGAGFDFLMLVSGCAYWLERGTGIPLESERLLVVERDNGGCLRGAKYESAFVNVFTIRVEWLQGIISYEEQSQIKKELRRLSLPALMPKEHPATLAFHSYVNQKQASALYARVRSLEVLASLLRIKGGVSRIKDCGDSFRNGACETKVKRIIGEIPLAEMRDLSLTRLAEDCGCSVRHAGRVFRQLFGDSLRSKQVEIRMDQATEFLSTGGYTIDRVASLCGYADAQHFRVAFKRRFGKAPTDWQNDQGLPKQGAREGREMVTKAG